MSAKLEQFLFFFLFFAIPLQTRKILYSPGWYYNEWQAISVYLTDLILAALLIFWAVDKRHGVSFIHRYDYFLLGFLAVALISVKNSSDLFVGLFHWLKLVEFSLFYFYLKNYAVQKFNFITVLHVLLLGGTFQAVVAIGQFLKQGSLGLTSFGESVIGPQTTGIASFFVASGDKVIRAYGTTPHPNVLAAYLFLAIFAFYFAYIRQDRSDNGGYLTYDTMKYHKLMRMWWAWYSLLLFGLFFTFSRAIIFLWAIGFFITHAGALIYGNIKVWRKQLMPLFLTTLAVVSIFSFLYWPEVSSRLTISGQEEAVQLRVFYNEESLKGGINLFGIGLGDFTGWLMEQNPNLPSYVYQPVHNIYLLVYSEIGIIGFVLFLLFLAGLIYEFIKKTRLRELWHYSFLLVSLSVLFIGLFDHFLVTLQQGRFVFWLSLTVLAVGDIINKQLRNGG